MKEFPVKFVTQSAVLDKNILNQADAELLESLRAKGYDVVTGLTAAYAADIVKMCRQSSILEYCPNDSGKRFTDLNAAETWQAKGRLVFLLVKPTENGARLAGYGWSGREASEKVPEGQATFALRVGEDDQGNGLATPFARLILVGSLKMQAASDFWLETWQSDGAAVHIYTKLGFEQVTKLEGQRPIAAGGFVDDIRLYMSLPNERL